MEGNYNEYRSETELDGKFYVYPTNTNRSKIRVKLEDGFEKTKAVASTGFKKIKRGSTVGLDWIKHKYQKTTHKQSYY
ncbi:hypothetical protein QVD17_25373 [Tagetes erecta]|uniref:Uncharacterized protein n=1 Tax=Tagetes erecta TaxID=13708 RepID=A0AAD8KFY9_TARER|nr:hypothetical protein QVD17_25373 [Tagetes erecta]